jgi:hypothetical protein
MTIDAKNVRSLFNYDPLSGDLIWKIRPSIRVRSVGAIAGYVSNNGYRRVEFDGRSYLAHRIIWLWMTRKWPLHQIDHIDLNRANNRWTNLREATRAQNQWNTRPRKKGRPKGVHLVKEGRKKPWIANICANGTKRRLGYFVSSNEAAEAYQRAAAELHGKYMRIK